MPQVYAALIVAGHVLIGRKSMVNAGEHPLPWANVANGGYQWALPGGDLKATDGETDPLSWHTLPVAGTAVQRRAVTAGMRELEEETGLIITPARFDVRVSSGPGAHLDFYLVEFRLAGGAVGAEASLLNFATLYTALADPLELALRQPPFSAAAAARAAARATAVAAVRAQWTTVSAIRVAANLPDYCSAFRPVCDFEFSVLGVVNVANVGTMLGVPQILPLPLAPGAEAHIVAYATHGLNAGRTRRLRYTLGILPLPANPARALEIEWWSIMAGTLAGPPPVAGPPAVAPPGGPPPGGRGWGPPPGGPPPGGRGRGRGATKP